MHFSKLTVATAVLQLISTISAQSWGYEDSYDIHARGIDYDNCGYLRARDPFENHEIYARWTDKLIESLYTRAAEAEAERDALLNHLYVRGLFDAKLPADNPVSRIGGAVQSGVKASKKIDEKRKKDATKATPSFHQRTGGEYKSNGLGGSSKKCTSQTAHFSITTHQTYPPKRRFSHESVGAA
jgi:hypothetical protein